MKPRKHRSGFTLVELLLALTIMAMVMASLALAMHASFTNIQSNDRMAMVSEVARAVLTRMSREIRSAEAIDASDPQRLIILPPAESGVTQIEYYYESGTLYHRQTGASGTTTTPLIYPEEDVSPTSFLLDPQQGTNWNGDPCTVRVDIELTIEIDSQQRTFTVSAGPRRNQLK